MDELIASSPFLYWFADFTSKRPIFTTTWINMQDAFYQEAQRVGTWPEIGYSAPGTASTDKSTYSSKVFTFSGAGGTGWKAVPVANLNDCTTSMYWALTASVVNNDVSIADGENGTASSAHCLELTASWSSLLKNAASN